ncbi:MAG TPA: hypothetical protein VF062_12060 [Candidatus Limnocylindrales bacterium]
MLGGDPTGRFLVGTVIGADTLSRPVLWDRGQLTILDAPTPDVSYLAVNSRGTVAGGGFGPNGAIFWVYRDGVFTELVQPGTGPDRVTADRILQAVGWDAAGKLREPVADSSASDVRGGWILGYRQGKPARWSPQGEAAPVELARTGGINRHGWVAGFVREGRNEFPAVDFRGNVLRLPLSAEAKLSTGGPFAGPISDDGPVVSGAIAIGGDNMAAVRWDCR